MIHLFFDILRFLLKKRSSSQPSYDVSLYILHKTSSSIFLNDHLTWTLHLHLSVVPLESLKRNLLIHLPPR